MCGFDIQEAYSTAPNRTDRERKPLQSKYGPICQEIRIIMFKKAIEEVLDYESIDDGESR